MPEEISTIEEQHRDELEQSREKQRVSREGRLKQKRQNARRLQITTTPPNSAEYLLVMIVALFNDIVADYFTGAAEISGVWYVVLKAVDVVTMAILGLWSYFRGVQNTISKERANKIWRMVFSFIIELIPFLGTLSPTWFITVLLEWRKHRKAYRAAETKRRQDKVESSQDFASGREEQLENDHNAYEELPEAA